MSESGYSDPSGFLWGIALRRNLFSGAKGERKFCHCNSVSTSWVTIWTEQNGIYVEIPTATVLKISSTSTDDVNATGVGAWLVRIWGLDENYKEQVEDVLLNGRNTVLTLKLYTSVYRMKIIYAGTDKYNNGIIYCGDGTVTTGVPALRYCSIGFRDSLGYNQSLFGRRTIPLGYTGYVISYGVYSDRANKAVEGGLFIKEFGEVFCIKDNIEEVQNNFVFEFKIPEEVHEKGTIELRAIADASGTAVGGHFEIVMIKN